MNEAIKLAKKTGWFYNESKTQNPSDVVMDRTFWQALGKALGWIDKDYPNGEMRCDSPKCDDRYCGYAGYKNPVYEWHRFIDWIADGKDADSFFKQLIEGGGND